MEDLQGVMLKIAFGFVLVVIAVLLYLVWLVYRPLDIYYNVEQPYKVLNENKIVQAGEPLIVQQEYCKKGNYSTTIIIILENSFHETLRIIESVVDGDCHSNATRTALIPLYTPSGEYKIKYRIIVHVNLLREEVYEFETETFTVVNPALEGVN